MYKHYREFFSVGYRIGSRLGRRNQKHIFLGVMMATIGLPLG
jgi:hypothetical protein